MMKPILEEPSTITTPECMEESARLKSGCETPSRGGNDNESTSTATPPYVKWAIGFDSLLEDPEGQKVFQSYLRAEGALNNLMFWYAVNGFKTQSDKHKKYRLATVIVRTFLKRSSANALTEVASENRKQILDSVRRSHADNDIFDKAQAEIENFLKEKAYPMFLKSDVYIDYCNKAIQQQTSAASSNSPQNSGQIVSLNNDGSPTSSTISTKSTIVSSCDPKGAHNNFVQTPQSSEQTVQSSDSKQNSNTSLSSNNSTGVLNSTLTVPSDSQTQNSEPANEQGLPPLRATSLDESSGLPTVHEDTELLCKEINLRGGNKGFEATSDTFATSNSPTSRRKCGDSDGCCCQHNNQGASGAGGAGGRHSSGGGIGVNERRSDKAAHMYTNFAPIGSANDSEIQSLSSDTHTDDSASLADPSLDTSAVFVSSMGKRLHKHVVKRDRKYMTYSAQQNGSHARMLPHAQLSRANHYPGGGGVTNVNRGQVMSEQSLGVHEFAALLIQKLEVAKAEKERLEKYQELRGGAAGYHLTNDSVDLNSTSASSSDGLAAISKCALSSANAPNSRNMGGGISYHVSKSASAGEDPESIIDNHVSRVFCDSTHSPVNPRSKTPDRYATMHTHKCSSCGQNTFSQTLPPNYRNAQQMAIQQGVLGSSVPGYSQSSSRYNKQMLSAAAHDNLNVSHSGGGAGGTPGYYSQKSMRASMGGGPGAAHRKIMAESSSSKSTSSGVDSGVYDAQSLGSSDSYGGKHAMVTHWVETHRQSSSSGGGNSGHHNHHQLTKPEMNLSATTSSSNNTPSTMETLNNPPSRRMGGSSRSSAASNSNRHRWASVSPGPLNTGGGGSAQGGRLSTVVGGVATVIHSSPSASSVACNHHQLASHHMFNPPGSATLQANNGVNAHYQLGGVSSNTLPGGTSSHRRSPVSASTSVATPLNSSGNNNNNSVPLSSNTSQQLNTSAPSQLGVASSSSSSSQNVGGSSQQQQTVVAYYFCNETIPYRTTVPFKNVTLAQFKALLTRRGRFRYFFKMRSNEIELGGVVQQEITEDDDILPMFDGKIIGKIEKQ